MNIDITIFVYSLLYSYLHLRKLISHYAYHHLLYFHIPICVYHIAFKNTPLPFNGYKMWSKNQLVELKASYTSYSLCFYPTFRSIYNKIRKICSIKKQFRISGSPEKSFRGCFYIRLNLPTVWWQLGQVWMTSLHPSMQNGIRQQPSHRLKKSKKF